MYMYMYICICVMYVYIFVYIHIWQALSHWRISRHLVIAIDTCSALSRMSRYCQSPALCTSSLRAHTLVA